ncbi:MAG: hypothetical protein ACXWDO_11425 [Bacteroidia bacterium]
MNQKRKISKIEFDKLDLDEKCVIIEQLLTDDYFNGQLETNFWIPENFVGKMSENLPDTPPEIKKVEDEKFRNLIEKLSEKLFSKTDTIEYLEE